MAKNSTTVDFHAAYAATIPVPGRKKDGGYHDYAVNLEPGYTHNFRWRMYFAINSDTAKPASRAERFRARLQKLFGYYPPNGNL